MSAFMAVLLAAIPNAFIGMLSKLVTEKFLQKVMEEIVVYAVKKAAGLTTNTLDDDLAAQVEERLTSGRD